MDLTRRGKYEAIVVQLSAPGLPLPADLQFIY